MCKHKDQSNHEKGQIMMFRGSPKQKVLCGILVCSSQYLPCMVLCTGEPLSVSWVPKTDLCILGIHVDATLTCVAYLNIVANQAHPFMAIIFPIAVASFSRISHPAKIQNIFRDSFRNMTVWSVTLASQFSTSQSHRASVECVRSQKLKF